MEANQLKLLMRLAKKIKAQKRTKAKAITSLHSAGILTKTGNFTSHYSNLKKVVEVTE
jgi:hypothetical protein